MKLKKGPVFLNWNVGLFLYFQVELVVEKKELPSPKQKLPDESLVQLQSVYGEAALGKTSKSI